MEHSLEQRFYVILYQISLYPEIDNPTRLSTSSIFNVIVKFSTPMWYLMKRHLFVIDGPHNNLICLQLLKQMDATEMIVVKKISLK